MIDKGFSRAPAQGTEAASRFFQSFDDTLSLFSFLVQCTARMDVVKAILEDDIPEEDKDAPDLDARLAMKKPGDKVGYLRKKRQLLLELFIIRIVDTFERYIVELLREVMRVKPEILSSSDRSLSTEYVLQFDNMNDFLNDLIENRVTSLAYLGFKKLHSWCTDRGIEIQGKKYDIDAIVEVIATRNIIVHNRSAVDKRYKMSVPSSSLELGSTRSVSPDYFFDALEIIRDVVIVSELRLMKSVEKN